MFPILIVCIALVFIGTILGNLRFASETAYIKIAPTNDDFRSKKRVCFMLINSPLVYAGLMLWIYWSDGFFSGSYNSAIGIPILVISFVLGICACGKGFIAAANLEKSAENPDYFVKIMMILAAIELPEIIALVFGFMQLNS